MTSLDSRYTVRKTEYPPHLSRWEGIFQTLQRRRLELVCEIQTHQTDKQPGSSGVEMTHELNERRRRELFQIDSALGRMNRNEYGECEVCDDEIPKSFLHQFPYVRLCQHCRARSREIYRNS